MFKNKELLYEYLIPGWTSIGVGFMGVIVNYIDNQTMPIYWLVIALDLLLATGLIMSISFGKKYKQKPDEYTHKLHVETRSQMMRYSIIALGLFGIGGILYYELVSSFVIPFSLNIVVLLLGIYDLLYYVIYTRLEKEDLM